MKYNNSRLIPQPFIKLTKQYQTSSDGTQLGSLYNIQIDGILLVNKGSPTSSGTFYTSAGYPADESITDTNEWMSSLIRKQEAIRTLFAQDGKEFILEGWNGSGYLTCNPRVRSIEFASNRNSEAWINKMPYKITLEADVIYLFGQSGVYEENGIPSGYKIDSAEESWNIDTQDENQPLFRLTHSVQAKGKKFYGTNGQLLQEPWKNAQDYVLSKIGLNQDRIYCSGVLNLTGYSGYNYVRSQQLSELNGTFQVNESWICFQPEVSGYHAYEEFEVNVRADESSLTNVAIQGKIQGLQVRNNSTYSGITSTKYYNASGKYASISSSLLNRAQNYGGVALHPTPTSQTVGHNPLAGTINYTIEYNNRPTANISGARSEIISLNWDLRTDIFAELAVLDRPLGPVLQDINSSSSKKLTVSIDAVMPAKTQSTTPSKPDTNTLVSGYLPTATYVFLARDGENWNETTGRYNRQSTWIYSN